MQASNSAGLKRLAQTLGAGTLVLLLTWGEFALFEGSLLGRRAEVDFVLLNVEGILAGTPVWKSSQHRLLGPLLLSALQRLAADPRTALAWFMALGLLAENLLLWRLVHGRTHAHRHALLAALAFGACHWFTLYKLEYPWDAIDVLSFTAFGYWAQTRGKLAWLWAFLLVGTLNHETVLYVSLWCGLAFCDRALTPSERWRQYVAAGLAFSLASTTIYVLREALYIGPPELLGRAAEAGTPLLENPTHLRHNLRQFLLVNWSAGRALISTTLAMALLVFATLVTTDARLRRPALWSLGVLSSIFCFGYVNETRLYLSPLAFWFGYLAGGLPRSVQEPA